jgi:hypothetical protein
MTPKSFKKTLIYNRNRNSVSTTLFKLLVEVISSKTSSAYVEVFYNQGIVVQGLIYTYRRNKCVKN